MANQKITEYTELTSPASGDFFPVVDVSDTVMGASGTTKKIQWTNLIKTPATKVVATSSSGFVADYYADGTADQVEINNAIAAVGANGGGTVLVKEGTYNLSGAVTMDQDNVMLQGAGWNTLLYKSTNFNANMMNVTADNLVVRDLKIDGNRTGTTTDNHGIVCTGADNLRIINCYVKSTYHHGINTPSATNVVIDGCYVTDTGTGGGADGVGIIAGAGGTNIKIVNCTVYQAGYHCYQVYDTCTQIFIDNCYGIQAGQRTTTGSGIKVNPNNKDIFISNCYFSQSGGSCPGGIYILDGVSLPVSSISISNCVVELFDQIGIRIDGATDVSIIGCKIKNNGLTGSASVDYGIRLNAGTNDAKRYIIMGNHIYDNQTIPTQARPIGLFGTNTDKIVIVGNIMYNHVTSNSVNVDSAVTGSQEIASNFEG
jgi:hypothetical protein